ncbi:MULTISPECIES: hypothetical protein [unclassified Lentimicrobium]|uniref:hypothetical protein n=1 Tax=unclassified Lentimicrobium TaxID=2677434 RepID=UPI001557E4EF|nr:MULTISPECIES: hypothetical protein [unclassified Lentimicrobium]NPD47202.1 hypothetical protein [Lentimicrobium sp. S6]NPD84875.1 hypothetical protein [Lentimicrobium sp. L6]
MDNILKKAFFGIAIILILIATAYQIAVLYQGDDSVTESVLNGYFLTAYIAFSLSVVIALLFPVLQIISNPKGAIRTLIIIVAAVALWFVAKSLATNTFTPDELEAKKITAETSVMVGAGLIYTYVVFGLAILSILYASISNMFK